MKKKVKHLILAVFSIILVLSSLFLSMPANNASQMKSIKFGYPLHFVSQDFSSYNAFSFFPRYQKFEFNNLSKIVEFSISSFIISVILVFICIEVLIYFLEYLKYLIFERVFAKKDDK